MRKKLLLFVSLQLIIPTIFTLSSQQVHPVSNLWIDEDGKSRVVGELKGSDDKPHQISLKASSVQQVMSQTSPGTSVLISEGNLTFTTPYGTSYSHPNLRIYVRVINNGDGAATFTRLGYYLSPDASITKNDIFLGDDYVSTLSIGSHSDEEIIVDVSAYPGDWYAGFIIDYLEESIEDNENDNIWCSSQFTIWLSEPWGPILVSPSDDATNVSIKPTLSWREGGGGPTDRYKLMVYDEVAVALECYVFTSTTSVTVGPLSYNTLYSWQVRARNSAGDGYSAYWSFTTESESGLNDQDPVQIVPCENLLLQNYPNPFNPVTTIQYHVPENDKVLLKIFDINGEEIQTLVNAIQTSGFHKIIWDGKDNVGRNVSSGVYFYRLETSLKQETRKMLLIR